MLDKLRTIGWDIQLGLLAISAVLLGIPVARAEINHVVALPELVYVMVAIAGVALAGIALVGLIALLIDVALWRRRIWCECRPVSRRNIHEVFKLMRDFFGDETPSVTRMLQWQRQNKTVLTAVYIQELRAGRRRSTLAGVYKIVPLTASAVEALESERKTGATIQIHDIAAENEEPAGLYIGDVLAVTAKAKAEVVRQLKQNVKRQLRPGISVYTRPLTSHGTRLVRKYKFEPIMNGIAPGSTGRIHILPDDRARPFLQ
jgi:hypothetical protein